MRNIYYSKDTAKIKFYCKEIKHKGQGHRVKLVGTYWMDTHVKYQSPSTYYSKHIDMVQVSIM
jgi:hypothetical protein